ncbi:MAG: transposase [Candidatus Hodarchaeales archaeon]|jgi:putative transposase
MYKPNNSTVRQQVWSELHKLFGKYIEGTTGWKYSKQSHWRPIDVFQRLVQAALEETSLEDVCTSFEGCSADTVQYRLNDLDFKQLVQQLNDMLRYTAQGFHIHGKQKITVAIDITDYPWYGDRNHELSVGSKMQPGTIYFNRYFTACILTKTYRIPIYIRPIRQEDGVSPYVLVEEMIREIYWWCPFFRLLGDAWFFSADLLDLLDRHKIEFLFKKKLQHKLRREIAHIKETQHRLAEVAGVDISNSRKLFRWLKKHKLLTFTFETTLTMRNQRRYPVVLQTAFVKKKKNRNPDREYLDWYVYTTNIPASGEYLKNLYKSRWGIETQYRVVHQFQAKTTSSSTALRILLTGLSFVLTGIWLRINAFINRTKSKSKQVLDYDLPLRIYSTDRLNLTVSKLKRMIQTLWRLNYGGEI